MSAEGKKLREKFTKSCPNKQTSKRRKHSLHSHAFVYIISDAMVYLQAEES